MWRKLCTAVLPVLIGVVLLTVNSRDVFDGIERAVYDSRLSVRAPSAWPDELVLVGIGDNAQAEHGPWRRNRAKQAMLFERLHELGAGTVVSNLLQSYSDDPTSDGRLADALRGAVLPVDCGSTAESFVAPPRAASLTLADGSFRAVAAHRTTVAIPAITTGATGLGHACLPWGKKEATLRYVDPAIRMAGTDTGMPILGLRGWLQHHGIEPADVTVTDDTLAVPGHDPIPLQRGRLMLDFARTDSPLPVIDAADVLNPELDSTVAPRLRGKLVLVGMTGRLTQGWQTPVGSVPGAEIQAYAVRTVAGGRTPRPIGLRGIFPAFCLLFVFFGLVATRCRPLALAGITLGLLAGYSGLCELLVRGFDIFLPFTVPVLQILASGAALSLLPILWLERDAKTLATRARELEAHLALAPASGDADEAPDGQVALVFTDVQGSTELWERYGQAMQAALDLHDDILRSHMKKFDVYEVKTEGDAFMVSAESPLDAVRWCLAVQEALMQADWPEEILEEGPACLERTSRGEILNKGLRVRMGVHLGTPDARPNPLVHRMDYFGPVVNRAARVSDAAHGGQILLSGDAWEAVQVDLYQLGFPQSHDLGLFELKGLQEAERLVEIMPRSLASRAFPAPRTRGATSEHAAVDPVAESTTASSPETIATVQRPDASAADHHWDAPSFPGVVEHADTTEPDLEVWDPTLFVEDRPTGEAIR